MSDHTQEPIYQDRFTGENFPDARAMVNRYLAKFSAHMKLPTIELDATGHADVQRGSATVGINLLHEQGVLMIFAPVMDVPITGREAFYRTLLDMSFVATQDAAFAIDGPRDKVVLRVLRRLSALDYEEFDDLLVTVGQVADHFDDRLIAEYGT
ncbi:MAG TPA: YbjN domain-containing protein [Polyangiaceae bacterium]|nr:YbjN domain-containing protein [Polyangiaceae bacterium]